MNYVFDASALIALLTGEPGAGEIELLFLDQTGKLLAHAANIYEVYRHIDNQEGSLPARRALARLQQSGLEINARMDIPFLIRAAGLRKMNRMSMADTFGLALAAELDGEFVTADHHELDTFARAGTVKIRFFR